MGNTSLVVAVLTKDEARSLTDQVRNGALELADSLQRLYDGGAHTALEYSSWGAYFKAEFGKSASRGYQLLRAHKVAQCTNVHSEGVARELVAVEPEARQAVLDAASENGHKPTANGVRSVLDRVLPRAAPKLKEKKPAKDSGRHKKPKITAEQVKEATRKLRSGKEIVTPAMRQRAIDLFGKLVRALDKIKVSAAVRTQLDDIVKAIKAAK